jgi:cell division inhibitor SepF
MMNMGEGLFKRAKAFIGLAEEEIGEEGKGYSEQLDMATILKNKKSSKEEGGYEIVFYEPKVYEDSLNISTHLRSGSPVIISLKHLDPAEGTRLIDFVCGTAYAIDGHMIKVGESIFLFAPAQITINSSEDRSSLGEELAYSEEKRDAFFSR